MLCTEDIHPRMRVKCKQEIQPQNLIIIMNCQVCTSKISVRGEGGGEELHPTVWISTLKSERG